MMYRLIAALVLTIVPMGNALAQSSLDRATTRCLFEVENGGDLHVTIVNRGGKEIVRVKNKKRRIADDPTVTAYKTCVKNKLAMSGDATLTTARASNSSKPVAKRRARLFQSARRSEALCPRYAPTLYRGTIYCIGR